MGDDCTPGRGIRDMMRPEADKPEAVDCAANIQLKYQNLIFQMMSQNSTRVKRK